MTTDIIFTHPIAESLQFHIIWYVHAHQYPSIPINTQEYIHNTITVATVLVVFNIESVAPTL